MNKSLQHKGYGLGRVVVDWASIDHNPDAVQEMLSRGIVLNAYEDYRRATTEYFIASREWGKVPMGDRIPEYVGVFLHDKFSHFEKF